MELPNKFTEYCNLLRTICKNQTCIQISNTSVLFTTGDTVQINGLYNFKNNKIIEMIIEDHPLSGGKVTTNIFDSTEDACTAFRTQIQGYIGFNSDIYSMIQKYERKDLETLMAIESAITRLELLSRHTS